MSTASHANGSRPPDFAKAVLASLQADGNAAELVETHISWVFLTADAAYKIKKPVKNDFLDFSTLARRKYFCEEQLRLDRRFAADIYESVLPITWDGEQLLFDGAGQPCEYAVKMRRFPTDDLLSRRLKDSRVTLAELERFAHDLADFHRSAAPADSSSAFGEAKQILQDARDNLTALEGQLAASQLMRLRSWTEQTGQSLTPLFRSRQQQGYIRECHGDLHAGNIVWWRRRFIPFDGIEFNEQFRWIDCLSDAAFLAMDLMALGRSDLSHIFINSYLENCGDYGGLALLRWYMVYRALVRAKVSALAMHQQSPDSAGYAEAQSDLQQHVQLAEELVAHSNPCRLWITHGVSGSGKSTAALRLVERQGAVRLRSDVERKRLWGKPADFRPDAEQQQQLYGSDMNEKTYQRLLDLSREILTAGYPVVVDAAFLRRQDRDLFRQLADQLQLPFVIVDCRAEPATLQRRLAARQRDGRDASDADEHVLRQQLATQEVLDSDEKNWTVASETLFAEEPN